MSSPNKPWQEKLLHLVGEQRSGSDARRAAFVCWMCIPVYLLFAFWALGGWFLSVDNPALDGQVLSYTTLYGFLMTFIWTAAGVHGLQLDHLGRPDANYVRFVLGCYAVTTALTCYLVGTLSIIAGLVMMGAPLIGMMLFPVRRILGLFVLSSAVILGAGVCSSLALIPYAPVLNAGLATTASPGLYYAMSGTIGSALYVTYEVLVMVALVAAAARGGPGDVVLSVFDPLTGLASRERLLELLSRRIGGAHGDEHIGVLLVRIDNLDAINELHGFLTGDKVLLRVAGALRRSLRQTDVIGRFNGARFMVILPDASPTLTQEVAARCCQALDVALSDPHDGLPALSLRSNISLKSSLGVMAGLARELPQAEQLVQRLDEALSTARRTGQRIAPA